MRCDRCGVTLTISNNGGYAPYGIPLYVCKYCYNKLKEGGRIHQIVNEKNIDEIKDKNPPSKSFIEAHHHYCKTCNDKICCNKGKDKWAYCAGG